MEQETHSIQGASAAVGGEALRALSFTIEIAAEAGNRHTVRTVVGGLWPGFEQLKQTIEASALLPDQGR